MMAGLQAGKFDVIMDALSITPEREKQIAFSIPYASTPAGFAALKDGPLGKLARHGHHHQAGQQRLARGEAGDRGTCARR